MPSRACVGSSGTSASTALPTAHLWPTTAPETSIPRVVRFSPNVPEARGLPPHALGPRSPHRHGPGRGPLVDAAGAALGGDGHGLDPAL